MGHFMGTTWGSVPLSVVLDPDCLAEVSTIGCEATKHDPSGLSSEEVPNCWTVIRPQDDIPGVDGNSKHQTANGCFLAPQNPPDIDPAVVQQIRETPMAHGLSGSHESRTGDPVDPAVMVRHLDFPAILEFPVLQVLAIPHPLASPGCRNSEVNQVGGNNGGVSPGGGDESKTTGSGAFSGLRRGLRSSWYGRQNGPYPGVAGTGPDLLCRLARHRPA